jgi:8-oxo-dGTP diphosphatase
MADTKRSVAGIAVEEGKIFIAKRSGGGSLGGKWEFPGGKAEDGETDEEALVREYDEEFGVPIRVGDFLGRSGFEHSGVRRILSAYRISFIVRQFILHDHTEWSWVSFDELGSFDFAE